MTKIKCPIYLEKMNKLFFSELFEDYILSIVFSDIKKGVYIDIGAYHSKIASVTKFFYDKGWHGINIEPAKKLFTNLQQNRPRDINLNIGIANKAGNMKFYDGLGQSSTFDYKIASKTSNSSKKILFFYYVPIMTLDEVLKLYPLPTIDFIKIDVEGFEKQVLQGLNLSKYRPKVFIIEAIKPITLKPSHRSWEYILLNNNYELIIFDGINRYYLAKEHNYLLKKFIHAGQCACLENQRLRKKYIWFSNAVVSNKLCKKS